MKSMKWQRRANIERLFLEAERYEGKGDFKAAFDRLLAAAQKGHAMSQLNLGNFYASGRGTRRSLDRAIHWYRRAYQNGYNDGAFNLAIERKKEGNVRAAVLWFKKAAAMNCGEAYVELAKIYKARRGSDKIAHNLLKEALRMRRDQISEDAREQAESMLNDDRHLA